MMTAPDVRRLAHIDASCILFCDHIWLNNVNVNPLT